MPRCNSATWGISSATNGRTRWLGMLTAVLPWRLRDGQRLQRPGARGIHYLHDHDVMVPSRFHDLPDPALQPGRRVLEDRRGGFALHERLTIDHTRAGPGGREEFLCKLALLGTDDVKRGHKALRQTAERTAILANRRHQQRRLE